MLSELTSFDIIAFTEQNSNSRSHHVGKKRNHEDEERNFLGRYLLIGLCGSTSCYSPNKELTYNIARSLAGDSETGTVLRLLVCKHGLIIQEFSNIQCMSLGTSPLRTC